MAEKKTDVGGQDTTFISGISGESLGYLPGDIVDGTYILRRLIGRGGMGAIFECFHQGLDRNYAIKILSASNLTSEAWNRFQSEAQSLARLKHPGIVGIYNMGIDKNQCPYFVMDLIEGESLDKTIARSGPLSIDQALDIFIQVCDALSSAHAQGIVHRDLKPSNIMLVRTIDTVKAIIVDFGIARVSRQNSSAQSQTATGLIFGTPFYMSPEQCEGSHVDERSDIYSLGCSLFEALTGSPPFVGESAFLTFLMHQTSEIPTLGSRAPGKNFPPPLELALKKMLGKKAEERYRSMKQVEQDLSRIKAGKTIMLQGAVKATSPPYDGPAQSKIFLANDDAEEKAELPLNKYSIAVLALLAVAIIGLTAIFLVPGKQDAKETRKVETLDTALTEMEYPRESLKRYGASQEELNATTEDDVEAVSEVERKAEKQFEKKRLDKNWWARGFRNGQFFDFPTDVVMGDISVDNKTPEIASGHIHAPKNQDCWLYLNTGTRKSCELIDKFAPDDLTGISAVFWDKSKIPATIKKMATWTRLKDLWFFNPLLKTIAVHTEDWAETKIQPADLQLLQNFKNLRSLGICFPIKGSEIASLPLLKQITGLGIERVPEFDLLLERLPTLNNLQELLIMNEDTTDLQMATLARMPNLHKLTVLRGRLTLSSLTYFKTFPSLKELRLDRNDWTEAEKKDFAAQLPGCKVSFEKVIDRQYWHMVPTNGSAR